MTFYEKSVIEKIPDNSHLVFLDVRSLYAIIPNSKGIKAVKTYFIFRKLSKKNISYKSNHYFSIVNLMSTILCSTAKTIYKQKVAPWEQFAHQYMLTSPLNILQENIFTNFRSTFTKLLKIH